MASFRFVAQTGVKDGDQDTRRSIRRHVMLGKNQGRIRTPKQPTLDGCAVFRQDDWIFVDQTALPEVPRRVGSDISFLGLADTVDPPLINDTVYFCTVSEENLFALEPCISFDTPHSTATCIQSLVSDDLHLNIMVFGAQAYMDQIFWQTMSQSRKNDSKTTLQHYGQCLSLLRNRLALAAEEKSELSDIIVISVLILASYALVKGEDAIARSHLLGLKNFVSINKSGIYLFKNKPKQMIEILRCDIFISLTTGQAPLFFSDQSHEPFLPFPKLSALDTVPRRSTTIANKELAKIWDVLSSFCAIIDEATIEQTKVSSRVLLETIASVLYRLLNLSVTTGPRDEAIRLAMISFCASGLIPWRQLRMPLTWLKHEYKRSITGLMRSRLDVSDPELILWCLAIYIVTFIPLSSEESNEVQLWLLVVTGRCGITTWEDFKKIVNRFLWIGIVYDHSARTFIDKIFARRIAATGRIDLQL